MTNAARSVCVGISLIAVLSSLLPAVQGAEELPGPLTIQVVSTANARPIGGVTLHVGGRMAITDETGKVVFDGLPAGTYDIWTRQPGHSEYRETVKLENGERVPRTITLAPEVLSPLKLRFIEDTSGESVGCARIHMVPKAVSAALQGPMVFATDSAGNVATIPVPEGLYHLTVDAAGYAGLDQDFEHKATEKPVEFRLKAVAQAISCAVAVTGEGGKPLPNADVELWEVYPLARIGSARTDAGGVAAFSGLRLGVVNPVAQDKSLPVTHRAEAVVRVQAPGYVAGLQSVRLVDKGRLPVSLDPQKVVPEPASNESREEAQRLIPGQSASLKINKATDEDWFAFELREPARVRLAFNNCPIDIMATLFDSAAQTLASLAKYNGSTAEGVYDLPAGRYAIRVTEWGMNGASDAEVLMSLTAETAADPLESNNSAPEAKPIQVGQHMRGILFPVGDADQFALHLDRAGCLRLESVNTPNVERTVSIFDKNDKACAVLNFYAGSGGSEEWQFAAGDYRIVVTEWNNNGCSLDPYDFRVLFATDDGVDDPVFRPGTRPSAVRHLPLYARTYASINPIGDRDLYTVSIPCKGTLHVFQQGTTELTIHVVDSRGTILQSSSSYAGSPSQMTYPFTGPATVYVLATEWNDNGWSPFPYELRTWFDPAGELERLQDNDDRKTATPIELGTMVRDNILPTGDQDWYQFVVDQPGLLNVWIDARPELSVTLVDAEGKSPPALNAYWNTQSQANWNVQPGVYFLQVTSWGNNDEASWDYAMKATLQRAVPGETAEVAKSPAIPLKMGEARPCGIEQVGDVERFRVSIPAKGEYACFIGGPLESTIVGTDTRTGTVLVRGNTYIGNVGRHDFVTEGPVELEVTVTEWGNNGENIQPDWIMVAPRSYSLASAAVSWTVDPIRPTKVTFALAAASGVTSLPSVSLDINADGNPDGTIGQGQPQTVEFPAQGLYRVTAWGASGSAGARGEFWVQATGQPVREGLRVLIATPGEGELVDGMAPVRVTAVSYEGKTIRQVDLQANGRHVGADYTLPFEFEVPWQTLAGGECTLVAVATDASGKQQTSTRKVQVSDYFNLLPAEGAVVTGNDVVVSWDGSAFGLAKVRYRLKGDGTTDAPWKEVVGQNARSRLVRIADLEAGKTYEYQPLGGAEPGPVREVTRVKGLAFTQPRYGGTIRRDYDQKIAVAVRNHAEEKRVVRLRCDQPRNSNLLVAFVGDGEKGRPVELGPGEQRAFTLGFSAQDVVKERHELPIYIESEDGYSDQAAVEVLVKLPKVDLEWIDLTPKDEAGLGRTYELFNKGDMLTDVNVVGAKDSVRISPEVRHGMMQAGQRMRFNVYPKVHDGFTGCEDEIQATSIGQTASIRYEGRLKPGEQVYRIDMTAGLDPVTGEPESVDSAVRAARRLVGQYLSPKTVDWSARTDPQDTDRDGKPDRWTVTDELNQTRWFGRDTDGDGEVDFAQADVGLDGEIDHSSVLGEDGWQATNLLDAWLEMNFTIPQYRSQYEPHDVDLVVNDKIVGQLKQTIPEGNYRFPLAPSALTWGGGENQLEINSHFRNFAHYAISSDFQVKTRLLGTDAYGIGTSREDAVNRLFDSDKDFSTDGPDYSISSEDLELSPRDKLKTGDLVRIVGTVRNLGAGSSGRIEVALFLAIPGTEGTELMRQTIASPGMMTDSPFEFVWPAAPGNRSLRIVADPDNRVGESNRKNNAAIVGVVVPGDDAPPMLTVFKPERDLTTDEAVSLLATAVDEAGIIGVDVSVDGGMAKPLYNTKNGFEGIANLQPGSHTVRFRVTDSGGLQAEETRRVNVEGERPVCTIISPAGGAEIQLAETQVVVSAEKVAQACARVNRGPWLSLRPSGQMWSGRVELPFGPCEIEALVITSAGIRQTQAVAVNCTA
ncbi:MAG: CARDB domain-containing protein, partial [Phycisphaerales bacterium]